MATKRKTPNKIVTGLREAVEHAKAAAAERELRRWCIEQALRWPAGAPNYEMQKLYGGIPMPAQETDVLARAEKIRRWVTV